MRRPMIPLTRDIAILDAHTRFTRLEIINDAPLLAAVGTAVDRRIITIRFHPPPTISNDAHEKTRHFLRRDASVGITHFLHEDIKYRAVHAAGARTGPPISIILSTMDKSQSLPPEVWVIVMQCK